MRHLSLAAVLTLALTGLGAAQDRPVLTVYTYDSFVTEWGPGPVVEPAFEAICACDLQFVAAGDGAAVLARLKLEGERTAADVVLGLDTALIATANDTGMFAPHDLGDLVLDLPLAWSDPVWVPFDWGFFAFVYDKTRLPDPPASLAELRTLPDSFKIIIQDPRSSTPGLGLLLWVKHVFEDQAGAFWADIRPNILTVTAGWSEAYGMFLAGEADMVLSYSTSPAYHLIAEGDDSKAAAEFAEGHYIQIEVAARLAASDQQQLAQDFLRFILSEPFQTAIPTTNWMYPAITPQAGLPGGFEMLIRPARPLLYPPLQADMIAGPALAEWQAALAP